MSGYQIISTLLKARHDELTSETITLHNHAIQMVIMRWQFKNDKGKMGDRKLLKNIQLD